MENTQATTTHPELAEAELEHATGGVIKNINTDRYDSGECSSIKEVTLRCLGSYTTTATWCKHYRREDLGISKTGPNVRHRCEKGCFHYIAHE